MSLSGDDEPRLRGYFERLGEGGTVAVPFEKAPWGDTFGMVVDRFGTSWMVNVAGQSARPATRSRSRLTRRRGCNGRDDCRLGQCSGMSLEQMAEVSLRLPR